MRLQVAELFSPRRARVTRVCFYPRRASGTAAAGPGLAACGGRSVVGDTRTELGPGFVEPEAPKIVIQEA
jgi:hypothetical protein